MAEDAGFDVARTRVAKKAATPEVIGDSPLAECLFRVPAGEPIKQSDLFPSGKPGQALLDRALSLRYVEECDPPPTAPPKRKPAKPPKVVPYFCVTPEGREWALQQSSPKKALEGVLAVLQRLRNTADPDPAAVSVLQAQLADLQDRTGRLHQTIQEAMVRRRQEGDLLNGRIREVSVVVERLVAAGAAQQPLVSPSSVPADFDGELVSFVRAWQQTRGAGCPLPELFSHMRGRLPGLTIGTFHDRLRSLHTDSVLRLSGMSGSLDILRDPELALLVSNKVMYYANAPDRPA